MSANLRSHAQLCRCSCATKALPAKLQTVEGSPNTAAANTASEHVTHAPPHRVPMLRRHETLCTHAPQRGDSLFPASQWTASMAAESHTGVGPPASSVSMPPEALPPELWHLIVAALDDSCFAWHVLRRVSPFLKLVTEDVLACDVLRTCSLRFAGQLAKQLL